MTLTRRALLAVSAVFSFPVRAQEIEAHGLSSYGELKYPANFTHFDYVNPNAPKGGIFAYQPPSRAYNQNFDTFNSFNTFILRGDAPPLLQGIYATLMTSSSDEADSLYGFVAKSVKYDKDKRNFTFLLRPEATFHDGTKLTAHDCAFSFMLLKKEGHPQFRQLLSELESVEAVSDYELRVKLSPNRPRNLGMIVAALPILSKAYYAKQVFNETTLNLPLGSSAYKVGKFEAGRFIEYERVKNWWGENLPVNKGTSNFDILRIDFYKDRDVAFEAFKAKQITFREEYTSRLWATGYDFPAVREGRVKMETLKNEMTAGAQGWYINTRLEKFQDVRVREALFLVFDYEHVQKNLQYNLLERTVSYFQNSAMEAKGLPSEAELALLTPFKDKLSPRVFGEAVMPPRYDQPSDERIHLRRALALFKEAGYELREGVLRNAKGEAFTFEFLDFSNALVPHIQSYQRSLAKIGIKTEIRIIDAAAYQERSKRFDFEVKSQNVSYLLTPTDILNEGFGSRGANNQGSSNVAGIKDEVIDALIAKATQAQTREELHIIVRCIDRILRTSFYMVPHWTKSSHFIAYFEGFDRPAVKPKYALGAPDTWWAKQ